MMRTYLGAVVLGLSVLATPSFADGDTFTQIGKWSCTQTYTDTNADQACDVNFPTPFGGIPDLFIRADAASTSCPSGRGGSYLPRPSAFPNPAKITSGGFTLMLPSCLHHAMSYSGAWIGVGPSLLAGTVTPNYIVLTVLYAPPGTNNGASNSTVEYAAGSTTGTTTTASQSFKFSNTLSFEGEGGFFGNDTGGGVSFAFSRSITDTHSLDIKKTINSKISVPGPAHDGIDHNEDEIWLLLKPDVNLAVSSSTALWMLSGDNSKNHVLYL